MSVVVVHEGILYTDSIGVLNSQYKKRVSKHVVDPQGDLVYAFCGDLPLKKDLPKVMARLREWWQNWYFGADQEGVPDKTEAFETWGETAILVGWNDGFVIYRCTELSIYELDDVYDAGDGGTSAIAGLDMGMSVNMLEGAINELVNTSGLGIEQLDLRTLADPVNDKEIVVGSVEPQYNRNGMVIPEQPIAGYCGDNFWWCGDIVQPWAGTSRNLINEEALWTKYGYLIPWGRNVRMFLHYCATGRYDTEQPIQGNNAGILISSDGYIYDVQFYGVNISTFLNSESRPGFWNIRPIEKTHKDALYILGSGWIKQYSHFQLKNGLPPEVVIENAHNRFATAAPSTYRHGKISQIVAELQRRQIPPVCETDLMDEIRYELLGKHYRAVGKGGSRLKKEYSL